MATVSVEGCPSATLVESAIVNGLVAAPLGNVSPQGALLAGPAVLSATLEVPIRGDTAAELETILTRS